MSRLRRRRALQGAQESHGQGLEEHASIHERPFRRDLVERSEVLDWIRRIDRKPLLLLDWPLGDTAASPLKAPRASKVCPT
ncbi:MAG TPA: hypothetical protein VI319_04105, partial [Burkholderiales bacterium]